MVTVFLSILNQMELPGCRLASTEKNKARESSASSIRSCHQCCRRVCPASHTWGPVVVVWDTRNILWSCQTVQHGFYDYFVQHQHQLHSVEQKKKHDYRLMDAKNLDLSRFNSSYKHFKIYYT